MFRPKLDLETRATPPPLNPPPSPRWAPSPNSLWFMKKEKGSTGRHILLKRRSEVEQDAAQGVRVFVCACVNVHFVCVCVVYTHTHSLSLIRILMKRWSKVCVCVCVHIHTHTDTHTYASS